MRIAISIASKSMLNIFQGSLIAGTQLLMISVTATPLNNASGVLVVISSIAVIGYTGNSPVSVTFITPNVDTITATNGVRIEWLNSFTYFADKGIYAISGSSGFAGAGLTRLRIDNKSGPWNVGDTVNYYGTDGVTVRVAIQEVVPQIGRAHV